MIALIGVEQTTSLLVVMIFTLTILLTKALKCDITIASVKTDLEALL